MLKKGGRHHLVKQKGGQVSPERTVERSKESCRQIDRDAGRKKEGAPDAGPRLSTWSAREGKSRGVSDVPLAARHKVSYVGPVRASYAVWLAEYPEPR